MSKIKILPPEITNLIAAGEVIERPASIVKELIENSLDAGANRIRVNIQAGGRKLVQVADNGCGMNREDAILCLEPHATSKIKTESDVESIRTMGFRGEALPSIAAVTRFDILTRPHDDKTGTEVIVSGGKIEAVRDAGAAPGTTITAKNLFFNMPVRRKFLRSKQTETIHIQNTVQLQALANPEIGFELIMDGKKLFKVAPGGDVKTRMTMLLGKRFAADMIPVEYIESDIRIYGFAARPGISRSTRKEQTFFINARPVTSDTLFYAVRDAYHTLLMKGRYAPVLLFLEMHAGLVDVNVHPQKREVRFRNNNVVGSVLANAVKQAIANFQLNCSEELFSGSRPAQAQSVIRPGFSKLTPEDLTGAVPPEPTPLPDATPAKKSHPPTAVTAEDIAAIQKTAESIVGPAESCTGFAGQARNGNNERRSKQFVEPEPVAFEVEVTTPGGDSTALPEPFELPAAAPLSASSVPQSLLQGDAKNTGHSIFSAMRVIGHLGKQFILAEGQDGLVVIDKRAAHSRIVYEKILRESKAENAKGQPLLIPVTVEVSGHDRLVLSRNLDYFVKIGFLIEHFGGSTYMISSVPASFPQENIVGLLHNILDELSQSSNSIGRSRETRLAVLAAKYSVPDSKVLQKEEIDALLDNLSKTEMPYTCPSGRPTMVNYAFSELESRFGRKAR